MHTKEKIEIERVIKEAKTPPNPGHGVIPTPYGEPLQSYAKWQCISSGSYGKQDELQRCIKRVILEIISDWNSMWKSVSDKAKQLKQLLQEKNYIGASKLAMQLNDIASSYQPKYSNREIPNIINLSKELAQVIDICIEGEPGTAYITTIFGEGGMLLYPEEADVVAKQLSDIIISSSNNFIVDDDLIKSYLSI